MCVECNDMAMSVCDVNTTCSLLGYNENRIYGNIKQACGMPLEYLIIAEQEAEVMVNGLAFKIGKVCKHHVVNRREGASVEGTKRIPGTGESE